MLTHTDIGSRGGHLPVFLGWTEVPESCPVGGKLKQPERGKKGGEAEGMHTHTGGSGCQFLRAGARYRSPALLG
jgi:hypothetical protein